MHIQNIYKVIKNATIEELPKMKLSKCTMFWFLSQMCNRASRDNAFSLLEGSLKDLIIMDTMISELSYVFLER